MNSKKEVQHVYLVGAKSLGAYGGYETFVYKLTEYHQNKENIKYHVACKANGDGCMDESKFDGVTKINEHEFELHNVNEKFLNELEEKLHFTSDKRIKFVGTVYDQELLKKIRENAYKHKLALTARPMPEIKCSYYISGSEQPNGDVMDLCKYKGKFTGRRWIDDYDYVGFLNMK